MAQIINCPTCQGSMRVRDESAGTKVKCPKCGSVVNVPTDLGSGTVPSDAPPLVPGMQACPECGKQISAKARKCRYCQAMLDDEEDIPEDRPSGKYVPCPKCGTKRPDKVKFTFWGSFYGPALFKHVRCRNCGYAYNGRTGRSNLIPAILFITIPLLLIIGVVLLVWFYILKPRFEAGMAGPALQERAAVVTLVEVDNSSHMAELCNRSQPSPPPG